MIHKKARDRSSQKKKHEIDHCHICHFVIF